MALLAAVAAVGVAASGCGDGARAGAASSGSSSPTSPRQPQKNAGVDCAIADLVRREYAEGNEVGNHTWDHKDLSKLGAAAIQDEITKAADAIAAAGVPRPTLVRPPYGAVNDTVRAVAGFPFIMWRVDPEDWRYLDAARVADQIVGRTKPGRIILSHDTHKTTVDAMPDVIRRLKAQGYTFVTVSTLMKGVRLQNGKSYFNRPPAMTGKGGGKAPDPNSGTPDTPGDAPNRQ